MKVRVRYPSKYVIDDEPTIEEIERTIAEQMKPENLPTWWFDDFVVNDEESLT